MAATSLLYSSVKSRCVGIVEASWKQPWLLAWLIEIDGIMTQPCRQSASTSASTRPRHYTLNVVCCSPVSFTLTTNSCSSSNAIPKLKRRALALPCQILPVQFYRIAAREMTSTSREHPSSLNDGVGSWSHKPCSDPLTFRTNGTRKAAALAQEWRTGGGDLCSRPSG
jgi:hypothetical protein